ncbi:hypothetical protein [Lacrimispora brassicae]
MKKPFRVKWFLFENANYETIRRFILKDYFLPLLVPGQYTEIKSVNK